MAPGMSTRTRPRGAWFVVEMSFSASAILARMAWHAARYRAPASVRLRLRVLRRSSGVPRWASRFLTVVVTDERGIPRDCAALLKLRA
ncbi:hypothetical protein D3C77_677300 [compost metagenome]